MYIIADTSVYVRKNISAPGSPTFGEAIRYKTGLLSYGLAAADFNGDGKTDIACGNSYSSSISILQNNSSPGIINFTPLPAYTNVKTPILPAIADLTGDGRPDLVTSNFGTITISLFRNTSNSGNISFAAKLKDTLIPFHNEGVLLTDFDGDGRPDMVLGKYLNYFFVFRNRSGEVLPLKLLDFRGEAVGKTTKLQWQTAGETNTASFTIERSQNNLLFTPIGSIKAAGNSITVKNYTYTDAGALLQGNNFYRLKMIDIDGHFTYSNIIAINFNGVSGKIAVYPNPAKNFITVKGLAEKTQLKIIDMSGKTVKNISLSANMQTSISVKGLAAGTYLVEWANGKKTETKLLVIE